MPSKALGALDEVRGEFWPNRPTADRLWVVKETACAAHTYGKRRVHMEAFTSMHHWQDGPFDLKPSADRAFCEGMNHVVWHTGAHQPPEAGKPGWVYGAGTHLNTNLVWWPKAKPFLDYLARCSFLLQQGHFVADVCYYYGDQGYNFVPPKHVDPSLGPGRDYDVVNAEVMLNRMSVRDGRITLPDGMQYELLVLPDREDMNFDVLRTLDRLVRAGGTIVGPKPTRSNGLTGYPSRDQEVKQLADTMWGECDGKTVLEHLHGKGKIIWGRALSEVLLERGLGADFRFVGDKRDAELDFIHRRAGEGDIYFIRNTKAHDESVSAFFRVTGRIPELWMPDSGEIIPLAQSEETSQGSRVRLHLPPYGSVFVVFRDCDEPSRQATPVVLEEAPAQDLSGPWTLRFPEGWGAPDQVTVDTLESWTKHDDPGIRYFSGTARYETEFEIPESYLGTDKQLLLDLGSLWAIAEVRVNGEPSGIVWKPPYRVDISKMACSGRNRVEVEVANTWSNRLVGDAFAPPAERYTRTNITHTGTPGKAWKDVPLHDSGLLGPVRLILVTRKTVAPRGERGAE